MANNKQRYVNTRFWNDTYVSELDPIEKLFFIYLITNEHTNISGVYELPLKVIALETGIDKTMIEKILPRLKEKIGYIDGYVVIKNFIKHQETGSDLVKKGIVNCLKDLDKKFLENIINKGFYVVDEYYIDTLSIQYTKVSNYLDSNLDSNSNLNSKISATKVASSKKSKIEDKDDPMTCEQFVETMRSSKQKHIKIIGEYADEKKPAFKTKGQWREFTNRNLKIASELSVYSMEQIGDAFELMMKDIKTNKNPKGFITKWGLETITKYLVDIK